MKASHTLKFLSTASLIAALSLTGCSSSNEYGKTDPSVVTTEQSEQLSVMRLNNYERGIVRFTMSIPDPEQQAWIRGRVDLVEHKGYANATLGGTSQSYALLAWTPDSVAAVNAPNTDLPLQPPSKAPWQGRNLKPDSQPFDSALNFILQLASDRPENALLLRQNGAQYHGQSNIDGQEVSVYTGPGADQKPSDKIRYFINGDAQLVKVEAQLGGLDSPVVITLDDTDSNKIELPEVQLPK